MTTDAVAMPSKLSPTSMSDFRRCPKLFEFKYIQRITSPPSVATTTGNLVHLVLERLFDLPPDLRTPQLADDMVEPAFAVMLSPFEVMSDLMPELEVAIREPSGLFEGSAMKEWEANRARSSAAGWLELAPEGSHERAQILTKAHEAVATYFEVERPANFDPEDRELHIEATIGDAVVHGYIDRLDRYLIGDDEERWVISDYKASKPPSTSQRTNAFFLEKILPERLFAMRVYALLLSESIDVTPHSIRLIYLGPPDAAAAEALPAAEGRPPLNRCNVIGEVISDSILDETRQEVETIHSKIRRAAERNDWPATTNKLCDWCSFKDSAEHPCPAFADTAR